MGSTPILFLVFNRPDTTSRVFDAIRAARPPRLYVAADGPRSGRSEERLCERTRSVTEQIDWPCEVKRLYRNENLGCRRAISSAITWFFENEEAGIILEDDCLPDPSFFPYCEAMLERFKEEHRVAMVSGDDFILERHIWRSDYYFATYFPIWGWASWRRAWEKYDINMSSWPEFRDRDGIRQKIRHRGMARWMERNFEATYRGEIDTWDFQWVFACLLNDGLSVCPHGNMISNIGFDGTHMQKEGSSRLMNLPRVPFDVGAVRHPRAVVPDRRADQNVHRSVLRSGDTRGWVGRLDHAVYQTWQRLQGLVSRNKV